MFNLRKDIEKYGNKPPYASEMYGIFQPLLGWESKLTKQWIQQGGSVFSQLNPQIMRILNANISPGPTAIGHDQLNDIVALPLVPGTERSPYKVSLTKDFNSELFKLLLDKVKFFVQNNNGRLPADDEWRSIIKELNLKNENEGALRQINQNLYAKLSRNQLLEVLKYESQLAKFLLIYMDSPDINDLSKLFAVQNVAPLSELFQPNDPLVHMNDPLATIDPKSKNASLAPVGYVDLFRQYFFDLGTFLGEPVEHIWLSPGTTIELYEISTRKSTIERSQETFSESYIQSESDTTNKDEISDAIKTENKNNTKFGMTASTSGTTIFSEASASISYGLETSQSIAKETMHKQSKEQTQKLSSEIKQSYKSVFKTVVETTDTKSRRHIMSNPGTDLINIELRRKMRRVGVQMQHIGKRLCWQMFIDDPGSALGLAELVHYSESAKASFIAGPSFIPDPVNIPMKLTVSFPYMPVLDYHDNSVLYVYQGPADGDVNKPILGIIGEIKFNGLTRDDDSQLIIEYRCRLDAAPKPDYKLEESSIQLVKVPPGQKAVIREIIVENGDTLRIILDQVHFNGQNAVNLDFALTYIPTDAAKQSVKAQNAAIQSKYDTDKAEYDEATRKSYVAAVRERIKVASKITQRPSWDLREEERTVVYRRLIKRLMMGSWGKNDAPVIDEANQKLAHVRSEIVKSLFDVDNMLYFVAPEWWMPRLHPSQLNAQPASGQPTPYTLTKNDILSFEGDGRRQDDYYITEESSPARMGSSLGWLLQLDGDNLRNAFLNAPWVKAMIPIRPGRETAALNWLKSIEGHENDGWENPYLGTEIEYAGKKVGEVLEAIADDLQKKNSDFEYVLASDEVYEHGFNLMEHSFEDAPFFSQTISILPTDQIVAVEYKPTDLEE
ncbi:hypothetical protein [Paenibacillus aceris]|uniref:Uncharacterized protein n=1 Tax=Paenibacillus aceris TaxID=869555 RepID=A0ABS4IA11_9BACL|nr:hypothetical protein [Paenibacillus aceris]MBP1967771.1 hypothetical protein [Paenibacillus aceris]NHW38197.1 hypothetical protein [Paenibacillus aceris]